MGGNGRGERAFEAVGRGKTHCSGAGGCHIGRMRLHRPLAEACGEILRRVFEEGRVLDRVLAAAFAAHPKWGKRDRGFVAESVYEVARWRRALALVAGSEEPAALLAAQWARAGVELPEWWRWHGEPVAEMERREGALAGEARAVRESVPDWLDRMGEEELGPAWEGELRALNGRAPVHLRVNTLWLTVAEAVDRLAAAGYGAAPVAGAAAALCLEPGRVLPPRLLEEGWLEIQDAGSQQVAPLLEAAPGMRVIDACAGAGGKTLHLAALMGNRGEIRAFDISAAKLAKLRHRVARARVSNVRAGLIDPATAVRLAGWADRLLLDVPCSGLGTLRRQPDLKWRLTVERLAELRLLQREMLARYSGMVKPGGRMVYATCSVLPGENRRQLDWWLGRGGWRELAELAVSPAATGWDGFYAAALERVA